MPIAIRLIGRDGFNLSAACVTLMNNSAHHQHARQSLMFCRPFFLSFPLVEFDVVALVIVQPIWLQYGWK